MALFKTIIIDRVYGNKQIPEKVRIISCCNPYRLRKTVELEDVALVFQHTTGEAAAVGSNASARHAPQSGSTRVGRLASVSS